MRINAFLSLSSFIAAMYFASRSSAKAVMLVSDGEGIGYREFAVICITILLAWSRTIDTFLPDVFKVAFAIFFGFLICLIDSCYDSCKIKDFNFDYPVRLGIL